MGIMSEVSVFTTKNIVLFPLVGAKYAVSAFTLLYNLQSSAKN